MFYRNLSLHLGEVAACCLGFDSTAVAWGRGPPNVMGSIRLQSRRSTGPGLPRLRRFRCFVCIWTIIHGPFLCFQGNISCHAVNCLLLYSQIQTGAFCQVELEISLCIKYQTLYFRFCLSWFSSVL